ncbi:MAG: hypothetical protein V4684_05855 [Pseudomonadota bacterium]
MIDARIEAAELFAAEGLECSRIPDTQPLVRIGPAAYATRPLLWHLYDFEDWVCAWTAEQPATYRAFGFAGAGFLSNAVHYYSFGNEVAFAMQLRWGSIVDDPDAVRRRYHGLMKLVGTLERTAAQLRASGKLPAGLRLAVAHSSFHGSRWAWLDRDRPPTWIASREAAVEALAQTVRLLRESREPVLERRRA